MEQMPNNAPNAAPLYDLGADLVPPVDEQSKAPRLGRSMRLRRMSAARALVPSPSSVPWASVALLTLYDATAKYRGFATGFFAKPDLVITAGHTLSQTQPRSIGVYPGFDARINPVPNASGLAWAWHDVADVAVIVTRQAANCVLALPGGVAPPRSCLAGYAFRYPDGTFAMTYGVGALHAAGNFLEYETLVQQGDSGSPVMPFEGQLPPAAASCAVHVASRWVPGSTEPVGVGQWITPTLIQILQRLEAMARAHVPTGNPQ